MRNTTKFFYDLETTGLDSHKNAIHQIAIIVEVNGKIVESLDWKIRPFEGAKLDPIALKVGNVVEAQIMSYPDSTEVFKRLKSMLSKYVDKYDKTDKMHLVGFNNRYFDDRFLRAWFEREGDSYFGAWFWADSLDVMVLASQRLIHERHRMKNFKLMTVAETLGVEVEEAKLHDGVYDVAITREAYNKIAGYDLLE